MRASVQEVCVDMWGGFTKVIKEVFPNANIVIDRFHVMKLVHKSLNAIRLTLGLTGLKNKLLLLKNNEDLDEFEREELRELFQRSTVLEFAYSFKEELREIYESKSTVKSGLRKMKQWLMYAQLFCGDIANILAKHLPEIANYFLNKNTSGVTEGINTRIKLIIRQSYGFSKQDPNDKPAAILLEGIREATPTKIITSIRLPPIKDRFGLQVSILADCISEGFVMIANR
jgi:transposase